jgi:hypothetical protein
MAKMAVNVLKYLFQAPENSQSSEHDLFGQLELCLLVSPGDCVSFMLVPQMDLYRDNTNICDTR